MGGKVAWHSTETRQPDPAPTMLRAGMIAHATSKMLLIELSSLVGAAPSKLELPPLHTEAATLNCSAILPTLQAKRPRGRVALLQHSMPIPYADVL